MAEKLEPRLLNYNCNPCSTVSTSQRAVLRRVHQRTHPKTVVPLFCLKNPLKISPTHDTHSQHLRSGWFSFWKQKIWPSLPNRGSLASINRENLANPTPLGPFAGSSGEGGLLVKPRVQWKNFDVGNGIENAAVPVSKDFGGGSESLLLIFVILFFYF